MSDQKRAGFGEIGDGGDDLSLMTFVAKQVMNGMATATLVTVKAVRDNSVDVQPMVSQIDGKGTGTDHGTVHSLPWFALRAGPCEIRIKPRVGDIGCAVFCHNDISSVKANRKPSLPSSRRRFDWSDGLYFGGFLPSASATTIIEIDADNNVQITAPTIHAQVTDVVDIAGPVTTDTEYRVSGTRVVGEQQGSITAPTGGSTVDSQARSTISDILSALRAHGLIET